MRDAFLPGLPLDLIEAAFRAAPGKELESGKLLSPESSAALAANAFGFFLSRPADLPPLRGTEEHSWPATSIALECILRFPWAGGRHPCLDVVVETASSLIGIESKRYEPYREKKASGFSDAYWRPVWGNAMPGCIGMRDALHAGSMRFEHLDAVQLVKHAFGLRSATRDRARFAGKRAALVYLYSEPAAWPDGRPVPPEAIELHRREMAEFATAIDGDEVAFTSLSYCALLDSWIRSRNTQVAQHAETLRERFNV